MTQVPCNWRSGCSGTLPETPQKLATGNKELPQQLVCAQLCNCSYQNFKAVNVSTPSCCNSSFRAGSPSMHPFNGLGLTVPTEQGVNNMFPGHRMETPTSPHITKEGPSNHLGEVCTDALNHCRVPSRAFIK